MGMLQKLSSIKPSAIDVDSRGNVFFLEHQSNRVRKVSPDGQVSTLAGAQEAGFQDGVGSEARFNGPFDLAIDKHDQVFISDGWNAQIRKITEKGLVSSVLNTSEPSQGIDFGADGTLYVLIKAKPYQVRME